MLFRFAFERNRLRQLRRVMMDFFLYKGRTRGIWLLYHSVRQIQTRWNFTYRSGNGSIVGWVERIDAIKFETSPPPRDAGNAPFQERRKRNPTKRGDYNPRPHSFQQYTIYNTQNQPFPVVDREFRIDITIFMMYLEICLSEADGFSALHPRLPRFFIAGRLIKY